MSAAAGAWLLAEGPTFDDLTWNFRNAGAGVTMPYVIFGLVVAVALVITLWIVSRWLRTREQRAYNSPRSLLKELCKAHGLSRQDRKLLKALARRHSLDQPSRLFLEPDRFEPAAGVGDTTGQRSRLERLRDRLFGVRLDLPSPGEPK
jgi:hypothetical protein